MTNNLTRVRENLRDLLKAGDFQAFVTVPERITPPVAFVAPGAPYLTYEGAPFGGGVIVHCSLVLVAQRGTNDVAAAELDAMVLRAIDAVDGIDDFVVAEVSQPGSLSINGQTYLAVSIEAKTEIHRTRTESP